MRLLIASKNGAERIAIQAMIESRRKRTIKVITKLYMLITRFGIQPIALPAIVPTSLLNRLSKSPDG